MVSEAYSNFSGLLLVALIIFYAFFFLTGFYFLKKELQDIEDYNKTEPFLHINTIRIALIFATIGLPFAAVFRNLFDATEKSSDLLVLTISGALSFILFIYSFYKKSHLNTLKYLIMVDYAVICMSILYCLYQTNLGWYYSIGFILLLFVSIAFLDTISSLLYFAGLVTLVNSFTAFLIQEPLLHPYLYLFAVCCVLYILLLLFVKNSQRISFSETILNTTKAFVLVSNKVGEIVFANDTFKSTMGYSDDDLLGNGWWQVRKSLDGTNDIKDKLLKGTLEKNTISYLETSSGKRIWIQWENTRLQNGTTIAIGTDISEKQEKEREFKHIVENAKDIIYTTDENGKFTYVNEIAVNATGYSFDEFYKMDFKELIHPDHYERVIHHNIQELKNHHYETYIEFPVIKKNGTEFWLGQQIIFKNDPKTGKFAGAQAICRDISERVKAEVKLSNYYSDLKDNYDLKQAILDSKSIEELAETVLFRIINNSRITQFITLNLIQEQTLHIFYTEVFTKKIRQTKLAIDDHVKEAIQKIINGNYREFKGLEDITLLHILDQPKFAKSALISDFRDGNEIIGFLGLYTNFEFDYEKHDSHFIYDVSNYIKTFYIEFEKNKIIAKKNQEIEEYSRQLESANEVLETRNRFQEMVIRASSFEQLNNQLLKQIITESNHAKTYSFNYLDQETRHLFSYFINKHNTFTFQQDVILSPVQIDNLSKPVAGILKCTDDADKLFVEFLGSIKQPVTNIEEVIYVPIRSHNDFKGFVAVYTLKSNVYTNLELNTIVEISNVLQIALNQFENQQLIEKKNIEIETQNKNLEILNDAKNKLINNLTIDEVFADLLNLLFTRLSNIERASVLKFDFDKKIGLLYYVTSKNKNMRYKDLSFDRLFLLDSFIKKGIYDEFDYDLKPDLNEDEKKWYYKGIRSSYATPIYINNRLYASINLFSNVPGNFTEIKNTILQIVSSTQLIIDQLINKSIISDKNKNISANINYAKRIQDAFLPNEDALKKVFGSSFAILMQRDALGGDFYWTKEQNTYSLLAVGDCTGHGVSGALLSVLATSYLNTIIDKWQNYKPGIILDLLSSSIYNSLHQKNTDEEINDGLDISFVTYDKKEKTLLFAGAMHTLYLNRGEEIIEYKGTRKPIGFENKNVDQGYETVFIQLKPGDKIYLTTDGIIDQFSSKNDKRLGGKRFKEIILSIRDVNPKSRKRRILAALSDWQANANQTDDICVISFEVE